MGMSVPTLRVIVCWILLILFPLALVAADTGSALLHGSGGVSVNGTDVADSTSVFTGDVIETRPGFVANLDANGSSVLIQGESIVRFQGDYLVLDHGSVAVGTSTSMSVHVNCLKVEPLTNDRTQYDVTDVSGKVDVAAHKNDVTIKSSGVLRKAASQNDTGQSETVHEGQTASREESTACGAAAPTEGAGSPLNTKWIEIGAGVGGGVIVLCLLLCKGKSTSSVSPTQP